MGWIVVWRLVWDETMSTTSMQSRGVRLSVDIKVVDSRLRLRLAPQRDTLAPGLVDVPVALPIAILLMERNEVPVLNEDVLQRIAQFLAWDLSDGLAAGYRVCVSWRAAFGTVARHTLVQVEGRLNQLTSSQYLHRPMVGCKRRQALTCALDPKQLASLFERAQIESDFWRSLVLTMRDDLGYGRASRPSDVSTPKHQQARSVAGRSRPPSFTTKPLRTRELTFCVVECVCAIILNSTGTSEVGHLAEDISLYKGLLGCWGEPGRALEAMRGVRPKRLDVSTDRMDRIRQFTALQAGCVAHKRVRELGGSTVSLLSAWVAAVMDEADYFAHEPDAIDHHDEFELLNQHQHRLHTVFTADLAPCMRRPASPRSALGQRRIGAPNTSPWRTRRAKSIREIRVRAETSLQYH